MLKQYNAINSLIFSISVSETLNEFYNFDTKSSFIVHLQNVLPRFRVQNKKDVIMLGY